MNTRHPTLMDILQPRCFPNHPKRAKATRTVLQPEVDRLGLEGEGGAGRAGAAAKPRASRAARGGA